MEYTVDYFINKFEGIPEKEWCGNGCIHDTRTGQHCAYGHCDNDGAKSDMGKALTQVFINAGFPQDSTVANINDGAHEKYQQASPKQRILAALYDIKKLQQPIPEEQK